MVSSLPPYALSTHPKISWTPAQEKTLATDYPFDVDNESDAQYVVRTYLQFLWLPESIMPLRLFVPSLQRVCTISSCSSTQRPDQHPLHSLLKPLVQTTRSASDKYHVELPQILCCGGGAGEIEETVMWYALNHEPADDELCARIAEGPWEDETWREAWLERMERREVQVQIMLYFLLLSLPGPRPPPTDLSSPKKQRRKHPREPKVTPASLEDTLEAFMDKLSMWQLMSSLEIDRTKPAQKDKVELDWMQRFFTEVIQPQFANTLPDMCDLLHSKVFPNSPFSSLSAATSPASSRAASPELVGGSRNLSSKPSHHRAQSPAASTTSSQERSRSRSLSVSLAEERMRERERSVGTSKKRALNREVSMSRAFKPKPKPKTMVDESKTGKRKLPETNGIKKKDTGVTLVEATPVKHDRILKMLPVRSQSRTLSLFSSRSYSQLPFSARWESVKGDDDEEEWHAHLSSTPDVLNMGVGRFSNDESDTEMEVDDASLCETPTKRTRRR